MASVDEELRVVEDSRAAMQEEDGRFATLKAYDGICTVLLAILQELREMREDARRA